MTKAQISKIDRLTAQLEALQNSLEDARVRELVGNAKDQMIRALNAATR